MATFTALASLLTPLTAQTADAPLNTYTLRQDGTPEAYDEALTVSCLQGLANRNGPSLQCYRGVANGLGRLDLMSSGGRWLEGRDLRPLTDLSSSSPSPVMPSGAPSSGTRRCPPP